MFQQTKHLLVFFIASLSLGVTSRGQDEAIFCGLLASAKDLFLGQSQVQGEILALSIIKPAGDFPGNLVLMTETLAESTNLLNDWEGVCDSVVSNTSCRIIKSRVWYGDNASIVTMLDKDNLDVIKIVRTPPGWYQYSVSDRTLHASYPDATVTWADLVGVYQHLFDSINELCSRGDIKRSVRAIDVNAVELQAVNSSNNFQLVIRLAANKGYFPIQVDEILQNKVVTSLRADHIREVSPGVWLPRRIVRHNAGTGQVLLMNLDTSSDTNRAQFAISNFYESASHVYDQRVIDAQ